MPAFALPFDLTTTIDPRHRRRLQSLPLYRLWRRWLTARACFIGSTCTEYAPLPLEPGPEKLVDWLLGDVARDYPFLIIKDLPGDDTLTGEAAHRCTMRLIAACRDAGFVIVEGQALAYVPVDFASVEEFLARMPRSRRKDHQRKLRSRTSVQVDILRTGDATFRDEAHVDALYALYLNVYRQSEIHFDLLSPAYFRAVLQDGGLNGKVFVYRARGAIIGYNLCLEHAGRLLDKYVGFAYPQAREHNLYALSWFRNLEYCIERGLHTYVAGWTDSEAKRHLGARFTFTRHAVYVRNPLLRAVLEPLRGLFESDRKWHDAHAAPSGA